MKCHTKSPRLAERHHGDQLQLLCYKMICICINWALPDLPTKNSKKPCNWDILRFMGICRT